jgi:hypothetical protein
MTSRCAARVLLPATSHSDPERRRDDLRGGAGGAPSHCEAILKWVVLIRDYAHEFTVLVD